MIVVDSSVLIGLLRKHESAPVARLRNLELEGTPFSIPAICAQEVLQGARDPAEWRLLHETLATQRLLVAADPVAVHFEAARIFYDCRRKGITVRSTVDCLVAALVLEADGTLLHDDDDYDRVARVRRLKRLRK